MRTSRINFVITKVNALKGCLRFSLWGADARSRRLLFYIGILASIWPARRPGLLKHLQSYLAQAAEPPDNVLRVSLRPPRRSRTRANIQVSLRAGNRADYQSIWECLNTDVYAPPKAAIYHILDGGANIGFFSIASTKSSDVTEVILVEPDPANLVLLRQNVSFLPKYEVVAAALDGEEGSAEFLLADSNTGRLHDAPGHVQALDSIRVPCRRLVNLIPKSWSMEHTWIKLDIEGAEYSVLKDMLISELRPRALSIEIHEYQTAGGERLVRDLEAAGYEVSMMDPGDERNVCRQVSAIYVNGYINQKDHEGQPYAACS